VEVGWISNCVKDEISSGKCDIAFGNRSVLPKVRWCSGIPSSSAASEGSTILTYIGQHVSVVKLESCSLLDCT